MDTTTATTVSIKETNEVFKQLGVKQQPSYVIWLVVALFAVGLVLVAWKLKNRQ